MKEHYRHLSITWGRHVEIISVIVKPGVRPNTKGKTNETVKGGGMNVAQKSLCSEIVFS